MAETTSFLKLPESIRLRILRKTGLLHDRTIHFSRRLSYKETKLQFFKCGERNLPVEIFQVCQQLYREGVGVLYGENHFSCNYLDEAGFRAILGLSRHAKSSLRRLLIYAGEPRIRYRNNAEYMANVRDPDFFAHHFVRLQVVCDALTRDIITPGQLHIEVSFSATNIDWGMKKLYAVQRISPPSTLRFDTWVGGTDVVKRQWQNHLRHTAKKLLWAPKDLKQPRQFPFEQLPLEIQREILSYAVVHPSPVTCLRSLSAYPHDIEVEYRTAHPATAHGCCGTCRYERWNFCRCNSDMFFSSSCTCPVLDDGIFLVNKRLRQEAFSQFYRLNDFVFMMDPETVLRYLLRYLTTDSWIWSVKKTIVIRPYYVPAFNSAWSQCLEELHKWMKASIDRQVEFMFDGIYYNLEDDRDALSKHIQVYQKRLHEI